MTRVRGFLPTMLLDLGIAMLAVLAAALARKFLLASLETRIIWVTFYPAVTVAALYGGWITGLSAAAGSCLIAIFGWPMYVNQPFIKDHADWLELAAFLINCAMISAVAEAMGRNRARAIQAKEQAEAANRAKSVFLANGALGYLAGRLQYTAIFQALQPSSTGTLNKENAK